MRVRWLPALVVLFGCVTSAVGALGTPGSLTATVVSTTSVRLNWVDTQKSPTEDGFSVERSVSATSGFTVVATTGANATSYTNGGLATGTTYYYRVRTVRGGQASPYSNVVSARPSDATPPTVPTGLTNSVRSCSQIDLGWSGSTDSGSGVWGYRVYRNNVFVKQVAAPASTTSDTGLAGSTIYAYQVSAVDNAGNESARSASSSGLTPACGSTTTVPPTTTTVVVQTTTTTSRPSTTSTTTPTSSQTTTTIAAATGAYLWSLHMGGLVLADSVAPAAVTVDASGNSYVTGSFYGTVNFGTGNVTSVGRADMFVAKYSSTGVAQWVRTFGDASDSFGTGIDTDTAGNVYVTGYYFGTVSFGGAPLVSNSWDVVLMKYGPNGNHLWSKRLGGAGYDMGEALAVDGAGNVLIGGQFSGTGNFGGADLTSAGGYDAFLAKYDTNGVHQWSKRMGGASLDTLTGMGVDSGGNVTAVGYFAGTANFGGANLTSAGSNDVFVMRYTAAGAHSWSNRYGDADDQRAYAAAVDGAGNVALTGYYYGSVSFGGTALPNTGGGADIFLAKLNSSGGHVWSKGFGTPDQYGEVGEGVAIDGAGNVVLTGEIIRNVDFGGGPLIPPTVTYDPFVAKFSPTGAYQWSKRFAGAWDDHGNAIAVDGSGNVIVTGDIADAINFGGGLLTSPGGADGFLAKFKP